jgi:gamma-glutamyltranspeptidase/glutathione hydrolase
MAMAWPNRGLAHRPVVMGTRGMVASAHPLASQAGLRILQAGGNAVDAAVAVAAALNVCEPFMSGAAGDGYMLIHTARDGKLRALDYVGRSPYATTTEPFYREDKHPDPERLGIGPKVSLVPGAIGGWLTAHREFGTLSREVVFAPAIEYAETGYPLTVRGAAFYESGVDRLNDEARAVFAPGGVVPPPGTIIRQPNLARTYRTLAAEGMDAFYRGELGERVLAYLEAQGGFLSKQDLLDFEAEWQEPIASTYRGHTIRTLPPPCSGFQYLEALNILEAYDLVGSGHNSAASIHLMVEAIKLAVADRIMYAARPNVPLDGLLSKEYAALRRGEIDLAFAGLSEGERYGGRPGPEFVQSGEPLPGLKQAYGLPGAGIYEHTTHFDVVDAEGNAVSVTQSLGAVFGSGVMAGDTGLMLNNLMYWFDLDQASPNALRPHAKIEMCMAPAAVYGPDGRLFMVIGTPGSFGILQTTMQMISNVLDHNYSIQAAIEAPRFRAFAGTELHLEGRIPESVRDDLAALAHGVRAIEDWSWSVGGGHGIMIDPDTGARYGGADPRRDGAAVGY